MKVCRRLVSLLAVWILSFVIGRARSQDAPPNPTADQLRVTLDVGRGLWVGVCDIDARHVVRCTGRLSPPLGFRGSTTDPGPGRHPIRGLEHVRAVDISVSGRLGCVVDDRGGVWCWGSNRSGQLGSVPTDPATAWSDTAARIPGIDDASRVIAAFDTACVLHSDGRVSCWGENLLGQLGNGRGGEAIVARATRVPLPGPAIDLDVSTHACAVIQDGRLACWGANQFGQLGNGTVSEVVNGVPGYVATPTLVPGISDAVDVEVTAGGTYMLDRGGAVHAWGHASGGHLGPGVALDAQGRAPPISSPHTVAGLAGVRAVGLAMGGDTGPHCVLGDDGRIRCWEPSANRATSAVSVSVSEVSGIDDAIRIDGGGARVCAVRPGGQVLCWGYNGHGELGGRETRLTAPTRFFDVRLPIRSAGGRR